MRKIVQCLRRVPGLATKMGKQLESIYRKTVEAEAVVITATKLSLLTLLQTIGLFNYGLLIATVLRTSRLIDHLEDLLGDSKLPQVERLSYRVVPNSAPITTMATAHAETLTDEPAATSHE